MSYKRPGLKGDHRSYKRPQVLEEATGLLVVVVIVVLCFRVLGEEELLH